MIRLIVCSAVLFFALTGCTAQTEESLPVAASPAVRTADKGYLIPVQVSARPDITAEKIMIDVFGRVVRISDLNGAMPPTEWTFEADEFRRADVLDKRVAEDEYTVVIFMTTRSNHKPGEDDVQVTGRLQLSYTWKDGQWMLSRIDNLSFRYTIGQAT